MRGRALDFGCGTGRVLIALAQRCEHVTGVDATVFTNTPELLYLHRDRQSEFVPAREGTLFLAYWGWGAEWGWKSYPLMMSASTYSGSSEMKRVTSSLLRRWPNLPSSGWSMLVATAGCTQSTGQRIGEALPLTDHARFPNFAFAPRRREITGLRAT
jgi:SAM-dependent methyltransferase